MSNIHSTKKRGPYRKKPGAVVGADNQDADHSDADRGEVVEAGGDMTEKQAAFVAAYVSGETAGNGARSAVVAGYAEKTARQTGSYLLTLPKVRAAIDATLREEIGVNLTVEAVRVIRQIITDKDASLKLRGDMAVKVLEFSGVVDRVKLEKSKETGLGTGKTLAEMTREELETIVRQGAAVLRADAALPPAGTVIEGGSAHNSAQPERLAAE